MIELLLVLVLQRGWCFCAQRLYIINNVVLGCLHFFAVFPFCLLAESYGHGQELAVFVEQFPDANLVEELLAVIVNIEDDVAAAVGTRRVERAVGLHKAACGEPFVGKLRADVLAQQRAQLVERVHVAQRDAGEGKTVHRDAGQTRRRCPRCEP